MARLSATEFESQFRQLSQQLDAGINQQCVECVRCVACTRSTFCQQSERLVGCHYCVACRACTECSHCRGCQRLVRCTHCVDCNDCTTSSYLVRCIAVSNCTYCFGCVGLSDKDFHILNQPYSRQDYFEITAELTRGLRMER